MKTRVLTLVAIAALAIAACRTAGQAPPPSGPAPNPGTGTAAPPPNPNPENPTPPPATPGAGASAPVVTPSSRALAAAVPDQPVAAASEEAAVRPHQEVVRMKETGASDESILEKIRSGNVNYQLTTADIVELRKSGITEPLLEAMLRSGQPRP